RPLPRFSYLPYTTHFRSAGAGVGDGDAHLVLALGDKVKGAFFLGGDVHQLDEAARPLLQRAEHGHIGQVEVGRVLGAQLVGADEGPFHVDTHQVGPAPVLVGGGRVHDAVQDLFRIGHGGGADGEDALAGLEIGQGLDGFLGAVAEIVAHGPVEV